MLSIDIDQPIGVFDSGLGGLTVLRSLHKAFPQENFIYLGDTARLPYGTKSPETILRYLDQNIAYLLKAKIKALVVACNSASTALLNSPADRSIPIYNVIEPGAQTALEVSKNKKIGILGTRATVQSQVYVRTLQKKDSTTECFQQACPLLVPLVEEGWTEDPLTNLVLHRYLQPLLKTGIDTLILGCTHYPLLKASLQKVCGAHVELVSSEKALTKQLNFDFAEGLLLRQDPASRGRIRILTTDSGLHFKSQAQQILSPFQFDSFEKVDL